MAILDTLACVNTPHTCANTCTCQNRRMGQWGGWGRKHVCRLIHPCMPLFHGKSSPRAESQEPRDMQVYWHSTHRNTSTLKASSASTKSFTLPEHTAGSSPTGESRADPLAQAMVLYEDKDWGHPQKKCLAPAESAQMIPNYSVRQHVNSYISHLL